ncbi:methyltransferase domain-containing protein [Stenotrophomonas sp. YIM B06876]|uniref:class I SAM-dependent methyltransferase n=1 Tax=Stenotrophomonas sp. YIM B06876 TaxID=3060211 RepID=UPI002739445D|nr:methyltransferase domain-containing protein [Stenotrophomonas sp. YIM B06876]
MPGYEVRHLELEVGPKPYRLRVLRDLQQFSDPDGHGARLGISSAQWSLFGQVWPAAELLALAMDSFNIEDKRILEVGCGIGLPSLVLQRRGAQVVASDIHPLAESFLAYNSAMNGLPSVHFRNMDWDAPLPSLGMFDVIIASDVMYERDHALLLAGLVERHALPVAEVVITDPGRGSGGLFTRLLHAQGFALDPPLPVVAATLPAHTPRVLHFRRTQVPRC